MPNKNDNTLNKIKKGFYRIIEDFFGLEYETENTQKEESAYENVVEKKEKIPLQEDTIIKDKRTRINISNNIKKEIEKRDQCNKNIFKEYKIYFLDEKKAYFTKTNIGDRQEINPAKSVAVYYEAPCHVGFYEKLNQNEISIEALLLNSVSLLMPNPQKNKIVPVIKAGDTLEEFIQKIYKGQGRVYLEYSKILAEFLEKNNMHLKTPSQ
ncbi:MAG: hypothetical protein ACOCQR_00330 [bacterium]